MGQYFRIVNLDKKEWIEPDGWKLWELCANNSIRMLGYLLATNNLEGTGLIKIMKVEEAKKRKMKILKVYDDGYCLAIPELKYFGRWCGDRIAIVGDYADNFKPSFNELKKNKEWKNITNEVVEEFNEFIEDDRLKVGFLKNIMPDLIITNDLKFLDNPKIIKDE